jgi:hypothetical protein
MLPLGHWEKWYLLDNNVFGVGPKIAAWILRDVSLLMDYHPEIERKRIALGSRLKAEWFAALKDWEQAYYLPIDRHVYNACIEYGVFDDSRYPGGHSEVQSNADKHEEAAGLFATWCRERRIDPRHLNLHWFREGSQNF